MNIQVLAYFRIEYELTCEHHTELPPPVTRHKLAGIANGVDEGEADSRFHVRRSGFVEDDAIEMGHVGCQPSPFGPYWAD